MIAPAPRLLLLLLLAQLFLFPSQAAEPTLSITREPTGTVLLSYPSTSGQPWRLQSSPDLQNWLYQPEAVMGNGALQFSRQAAPSTVNTIFWRACGFPPDQLYQPGPGSFTVAPYADETWYDASRSYAMPVRIYAPALGQPGAPYPLIVLSHGLAGSIGAFDSLSAYRSSHGFICVMIQHDDTRPDSRVARPLDVSFALDQILGTPANPLLAGRIDPSRVAHGGHSFGAFTTLAVLGARYHLSNDLSSPIVSFPDARVRCGIAYSPQGATTLGLFSGSWDGISRPAFTLMGTDDVAPGTTDPATRRQPYAEMPAGNKYHLTLEDAVHSDFSDTGIADHGSRFSQWYFPATLAFLKAHLDADPDAAAWLDSLALTRLSASAAALESK